MSGNQGRGTWKRHKLKFEHWSVLHKFILIEFLFHVYKHKSKTNMLDILDLENTLFVSVPSIKLFKEKEGGEPHCHNGAPKWWKSTALLVMIIFIPNVEKNWIWLNYPTVYKALSRKMAQETYALEQKVVVTRNWWEGWTALGKRNISQRHTGWASLLAFSVLCATFGCCVLCATFGCCLLYRISATRVANIATYGEWWFLPNMQRNVCQYRNF